VARVRTVAVALIGTSIVLLALRAARRFAIADRLVGGPSARTRLPAPIERRIDRALDDAMIDLPPTHAVQVWGGGMLAAAILGGALGGGAAAVAAIVLVGAGAPVTLVAARGRRARGRGGRTADHRPCCVRAARRGHDRDRGDGHRTG